MVVGQHLVVVDLLQVVAGQLLVVEDQLQVGADLLQVVAGLPRVVADLHLEEDDQLPEREEEEAGYV